VVAFIRQIQRLGTATVERYEDAVAAARKRSGIVENFWAAKERYSEVLGGRLAAAIAYYGFFAAFALSLVAFSVFGFVLDRYPAVRENVTEALARNIPDFPVTSIADNAGNIAIFGVVGLLLTGLGWIDAWRSSQRAIWQLDQHPGNVIIRRLVDLAMLLGLAIVLIVSLALADLMKALFQWISHGTPSIWNTIATGAVAVLVNVIIAYALLTVLPRIHVQPRRLIPPAVLVGIGLALLNWGGRAYVEHATRFYAAYAVVATAGGLLLYLYLYNQIVLWGAALAATSNRGRFIDLAAGPVPEPAESPSPDATGHPGT
jgi:membrane protein